MGRIASRGRGTTWAGGSCSRRPLALAQGERRTNQLNIANAKNKPSTRKTPATSWSIQHRRGRRKKAKSGGKERTICSKVVTSAHIRLYCRVGDAKSKGRNDRHRDNASRAIRSNPLFRQNNAGPRGQDQKGEEEHCTLAKKNNPPTAPNRQDY